jgi:hypothetical protein
MNMSTNSNEIHPRYLSIKQAIAETNIGRTKLYELINQGLIVAKKLGRRTFICRESIAALFAALPELKPKAPVRLLTAADLGLPDEPPAPPPLARDLASLLVWELEVPPASLKA